MKVVLIGGVTSTLVTLRRLHAHGFRDVTVFGYVPADTTSVSGWRDLREPAEACGFAFHAFRKIADCHDAIATSGPDVLFAVGLSQLVPTSIIATARLGGVGFHPTALPRGRGRAPIAWMVLRGESGAATFFRLREGVDDGDILVQKPFEVNPEDDAESVEAKLLSAMESALDTWLPRLPTRGLEGTPQAEADATYYGLRAPEDGLIDWSQPATTIERLVRASTRPHPGAFTHHGDAVVRIWKARADPDSRHAGVVGRILSVDGTGAFSVQCCDMPLRIDRWSAGGSWLPRVGGRLGLSAQLEVAQLRVIVAELKQRMTKLENALPAALPQTPGGSGGPTA
jgi:methionyl-tRNA formyltransferase